MIISRLCGSMFLFSGLAGFYLTLSKLHCHYGWLMATAKSRRTSIITSIDLFVRMDLSVTGRLVQANVHTCALHDMIHPYHNMLSAQHNSQLQWGWWVDVHKWK